MKIRLVTSNTAHLHVPGRPFRGSAHVAETKVSLAGEHPAVGAMARHALPAPAGEWFVARRPHPQKSLVRRRSGHTFFAWRAILEPVPLAGPFIGGTKPHPNSEAPGPLAQPLARRPTCKLASRCGMRERRL